MSWLRWGQLVRPSAPVAAVAVAATITAVVVWGVLRQETASGRLLTRVIEYHDAQYEINRARWQSDLDGARHLMDRTRSSFDRLTRLSGNPPGLPQKSYRERVNDSELGKFESRGLIEAIDGVGDRLRAASMHEGMTAYHLRMKFHYEKLRKDRVSRLPPPPASLEFERMRIEMGLRRQYGGSGWDDRDESKLLRQYESEPPPHLAPRPPTP